MTGKETVGDAGQVTSPYMNSGGQTMQKHHGLKIADHWFLGCGTTFEVDVSARNEHLVDVDIHDLSNSHRGSVE